MVSSTGLMSLLLVGLELSLLRHRTGTEVMHTLGVQRGKKPEKCLEVKIV